MLLILYHGQASAESQGSLVEEALPHLSISGVMSPVGKGCKHSP